MRTVRKGACRAAQAVLLLSLVPRLLAQSPESGASLVLPGKVPLPLRAEEREGKSFLSVTDVVGALEGTFTFDEKTHSFEVKLKGHSAVFGPDSPIVVVDTKLVTLGAPVRASGAIATAEPEFFQKVFGPLTGLTFAWDRAARTLTGRRVETAEIGVEATIADLLDTTKVVFRFTRPPPYRVEKTEDQILLKFPGVRLLPSLTEKVVDGPRVARLNIRDGEAAITLAGKGLASNVYALGTPPRIVVDITRAVTGTAPAPGTAAAAPSRQKTIVLDPGHGGNEEGARGEGARGAGGLFEKYATLALANTMQEALTHRGYRVVLTRTSDASVGLEDRAATANAAKADVFLSIHCNASRTPTAHGTEVYYLSLDASDRAAAALAERENRSGAATDSPEKNAALRDLDLILWDLAQNQHLAASERLAEIVQADFNRLLKIPTRGVKQAPFRVLIGVNAPAVLVEVAFITNPEEERLLASEEFRRQVAETLAGSLETYFRKADAVAPVPYAPKANGKH
jgi:N-acetylmuramoyl-L-alanine amidase